MREATEREVRQVRAHDGRKFGAAVAFEREHAELRVELVLQFHGQLLRAANDDPQRAIIPRIAAADVEAQERRRAEHERDGVLADEVAHFLRRPWVRIVDRGGPRDQRCPQAYRVSETVEERQHAEQPIAAMNLDRVNRGIDVRTHVAVREHDAFRFAGAAAGKDDGEYVVDAMAMQAEHETIDEPAGKQQRHQECANLLALGDAREYVFEINAFHALRQVERDAQHEPLRRDDRSQPGLLRRGAHGIQPRRVVQVHRGFAEERDGEVRERPAQARRQPDAHVLFSTQLVPKELRHAHRRHERLPPGEDSLPGRIIDHARPKQIPEAHSVANEDSMYERKVVALADGAVGREFLHREANLGS